MDEVFDAPMSQRRTPLQLQVTLADHEMFWRPSQHTLVLRSMATVVKRWPRLWKGGVSWNIGETNLRSLKIWERTTTNLWELFPQLIKQFCLVSWCQTAVPWNLNGSKIKNQEPITDRLAAPCLSGGALHERLVQRLLHQWWPFQSTKSYQINGRDFPRNRMEGMIIGKSSGKSRHPHENPSFFGGKTSS